MSRIQRSFYIEAPSYRRLKVAAALRGISISNLINEALARSIKDYPDYRPRTITGDPMTQETAPEEEAEIVEAPGEDITPLTTEIVEDEPEEAEEPEAEEAEEAEPKGVLVPGKIRRGPIEPTIRK